ncbi:MAG TPA: hypothetical protein VFQ53_22725, partial [Kofleriaceae bacterium]|nr:hypothetical protein [Kofleriaceae bacterium]
ALARDRARRPRQLAIVALVALAIVGVGLGADWILRDRARAVTRTSFAAARTQLGKLLALRTEAFVAQADALYRVPAVQEVAATRDLADFGLGDEASDRARRQQIHDKLSSASWIGLARVRGGDVLAIADDKGRLLFDSVNPALWDTDLLAIPPIARAYASSTDTYIGVTKGDDPAIGPSGLFGGAARPGLYVVFARIQRIGGQPRAVFLQVVEAARLLDEVSTGDDTRLSVTALDGAAEGSVPRDVIDQVHGTGIVELTHDRHEWLAETTPLRAGDQGDAIAQIVLARTSDVGLSGLFPYARQLLALTAALLAALAAAGFAIAHRRR